MDRIFFLIPHWGNSKSGGGDSFSDRLSSHYTVSILLFFAFMVFTRQYVGEPINCWCPAEFSNSMIAYTNKVCWSTATYYVADEVDHIPDENDNSRRRIGYYQWIALMFIAQAALFYVPRALWRMLSLKAGISLYAITDTAASYQSKSDPQKLEQMLSFMTRTLKRYILETNQKREASKRGRCLHGNHLMISYLVVKLLYILNVVGQLWILNVFLGTDFYLYGIEVMGRMVKGEDWTTSNRFPRTALCDFKIRVVGNIRRHTVQCSLPTNLLNEMFFIILWFWYFFVLAVTATSLLVGLYRANNLKHRVQFVRDRLYAMQRIHRRSQDSPSPEDSRLEDFVRDYLNRDGFLVISLVVKNSSDVIAAEITSGLWSSYSARQLRPTSETDDETAIV